MFVSENLMPWDRHGRSSLCRRLLTKWLKPGLKDPNIRVQKLVLQRICSSYSCLKCPKVARTHNSRHHGLIVFCQQFSKNYLGSSSSCVLNLQANLWVLTPKKWRQAMTKTSCQTKKMVSKTHIVVCNDLLIALNTSAFHFLASFILTTAITANFQRLP